MLKPLSESEIINLIIIETILATFSEYIIYNILKRKYRKSSLEILKLELNLFKSMFAYAVHLILLFLIISLPLIGIGISTGLSVISVTIFENLIIGKTQCPLPANTSIQIIISFLSLLVSIILMHYFMNKYGAIYKLPLIYFTKNDSRQFLKNHPDVYAILLTGFIMYTVIIIVLLEMFTEITSILAKEIVGIVITFLIIEILVNKKYDNAINFCKKFISYD
jgi:hypothetical protein